MKLQEFIQQHGYTFQPDQLDSEFHEFLDSKNNKGWYIGHETPSGKITFTFGNWRTGERFSFHDETLTTQDREEIENENKKFIQKKTQRQLQAAEICTGLFNRFQKLGSDGVSKYLERKRLNTIRIPGTVVKPADAGHGHVLVVPLYDESGILWNMQTIYDDGTKQFFNFGKIEGCFFELPESEPGKWPTYVCEGFATGASIWSATGARVIVAFTLHNLKHVLPKFPEAVLACDFDGGTFKKMKDAGNVTPKNPGLDVALDLQKEFKCDFVVPVHSPDTCTENVDFSDVFVREGLDGVTSRLLSEPGNFCYHKYEPQSSDNFDSSSAPPPPKGPGFDEDGVFVGDLKTYSTGFHWAITSKGGATSYIPNYEGLVEYFKRKTNYKILGESKICHRFTGTHYEPMPDIYIEAFAEKHFTPKPTNKKVSEFKGAVFRNNLESVEFFTKTPQRKINCKNGYYDIEKNQLLPHSKDIGFRYVLDYDFDPKATCPEFDAFMKRVTCEDSELENMILEFMGYCVSGDTCWAQKMLILTGEGSNGKSTFVTVMRALFGTKNTSAISAKQFSDANSLSMMDGKLANMAEETPRNALLESDVFKNIVTGGMVTAKKLYKDQYEVRLNTKLVLLCNELPTSWDSTYAFFRRFLIAPFMKEFKETDPDFDPFIEAKLLKELPGILNRVLEAYRALRQRRKFAVAKSAEDALKQYRKDSDPILTWSSEKVTFYPLGNGHDDTWVSVEDLYGSYRNYCDATGFKNTNIITFGKVLRRIVPSYTDRYGVFGSKSSRKRGVRGVTYSGQKGHVYEDREF